MEKITLYAGIDHFDYMEPVISTSEEDVENMDYTDGVDVTSEEAWIGCMFNDEHVSIFETKDPEEEKADWKKQLEEQMNDDESSYYIETRFGSYEFDKDEIDSIEEGISYVEDCINNAEADGDSSMGILWFQAKNYI